MLGEWDLEGFCETNSRNLWVSRLCLKKAKYEILAMFDGWKISENYVCPNFAPLFLKYSELYKPKIIIDLVTHVVISGDLTVKIVTFTNKIQYRLILDI